MSPDEQFDKIYQEKEDAKLSEMLEKLSDKEKKNLFDLGIGVNSPRCPFWHVMKVYLAQLILELLIS